MLKAYRKSFLIVSVVFICLVMATGFAFGDLITLDAIDDAGQYPGQSAYLSFQPNGPIVTTGDVATKWTSAQQVYDYADSKNISSGWSLESVGNIWSTDLIVGESLSGLHAGVYRISPAGGAYQYDSFGWSIPSDQAWRWEMHIQAINGQAINDYTLGVVSPFLTAGDAFAAVSGTYLDISMIEGGSLSFWIWDINSIDNSGGLSVNVSPVPEPATMLLLSLSLMAILGFRRLTE